MTRLQKQLATMRAWAAQQEVAVLPELERLRLAGIELWMRSVPCPKCRGRGRSRGCAACDSEGFVFVLGDAQA